ncbi:GAF domain-containing protein [Fulvivirga ligni]|uniref:GAF domain-containing protein n=1 Tax=Fulvivirga ligni TaxID=2904246 RepID=UPI001F3A46C0|nr:GAF domain-containing protein [Fulvivirga ligni]UII24280.1 hypothetical protein LVD16_13745 [Fulvivirga ligni]
MDNSEKQRIEEVKTYKVLNTDSENELTEIAQIAALMCDSPVSLITLVGKEYQWFKAKRGISIHRTKRKDSFCQFAIECPENVMVINDASLDSKVQDNPFVTHHPFIRFYAGAPLITPSGKAIGTLCVIDYKPKEITSEQKEGLQILARKVMDYLNTKKQLLESQLEVTEISKTLIKLTNNIPSVIFQLKRNKNGSYGYDFLSSGDGIINLDSEIKSKPLEGLRLVHPEDRSLVIHALRDARLTGKKWFAEFRVIINEETRWYMVKAMTERKKAGVTIWYGLFQEITNYINYEEALEQITFDISHLIRGPVVNLLGLANLIGTEKSFTKKQLRAYAQHIKLVSKKMDEFTKELNSIYGVRLDNIKRDNLMRRSSYVNT